MKETDLNIIYQLGSAIGYLTGGNLRTAQDPAELALNLAFPRMWLHSFMTQTDDVGRYLKDSRSAAQELLRKVEEVGAPSRFLTGVPISLEECTGLFSAKEHFEQSFERESKSLMVFTVTPKGTYDTSVMLENPQQDFPPRLLAELPARFIGDLKQAAKCLVFDIPVGCAFHVCRATESLMIAYYEKLAKQKWPLPTKRDWNTYNISKDFMLLPLSLPDCTRYAKWTEIHLSILNGRYPPKRRKFSTSSVPGSTTTWPMR